MAKGEKNWEPEEKDELKRLWLANEGIRRLMSATSKTKSQVLKMRLKLGLPDRTVRQTRDEMDWTESQTATLKREWIKGTSVKRICEMTNRLEPAVKAKRISLGLEGRRSKNDNADMVSVVVYMAPENNRRISGKAMAQGMSRSGYINKLILRDIC